ncbi:hypothetical protein NMG60_11021398 [Bertholletia excelsa]
MSLRILYGKRRKKVGLTMLIRFKSHIRRKLCTSGRLSWHTRMQTDDFLSLILWSNNVDLTEGSWTQHYKISQLGVEDVTFLLGSPWNI